MRGLYVCTMPDTASWRILRCDGCRREVPERIALCFSCLVGDCHGRLRPIHRFIPKAERREWEEAGG